jgi:hypothetical protein
LKRVAGTNKDNIAIARDIDSSIVCSNKEFASPRDVSRAEVEYL